MAKLLVAAGAFDHASGGEIFSPPHGTGRSGLCPAYFFGIAPPSANAVEVSVKGSAARAMPGSAASITTAHPSAVGIRASMRIDPTFPGGLITEDKIVPFRLRRQRRRIRDG